MLIKYDILSFIPQFSVHIRNKVFVEYLQMLPECNKHTLIHRHTLGPTLWVIHRLPILAAVVHAEHKRIKNERHNDRHHHLGRARAKRHTHATNTRSPLNREQIMNTDAYKASP